MQQRGRGGRNKLERKENSNSNRERKLQNFKKRAGNSKKKRAPANKTHLKIPYKKKLEHGQKIIIKMSYMQREMREEQQNRRKIHRKREEDNNLDVLHRQYPTSTTRSLSSENRSSWSPLINPWSSTRPSHHRPSQVPAKSKPK